MKPLKLSITLSACSMKSLHKITRIMTVPGAVYRRAVAELRTYSRSRPTSHNTNGLSWCSDKGSSSRLHQQLSPQTAYPYLQSYPSGPSGTVTPPGTEDTLLRFLPYILFPRPASRSDKLLQSLEHTYQRRAITLNTQLSAHPARLLAGTLTVSTGQRHRAISISNRLLSPLTLLRTRRVLVFLQRSLSI